MYRIYIIIYVWICLMTVMLEASFWDRLFNTPEEKPTNNPIDLNFRISQDNYTENQLVRA